jgi:hypothetical protein
MFGYAQKLIGKRAAPLDVADLSPGYALSAIETPATPVAGRPSAARLA